MRLIDETYDKATGGILMTQVTVSTKYLVVIPKKARALFSRRIGNLQSLDVRLRGRDKQQRYILLCTVAS